MGGDKSRNWREREREIISWKNVKERESYGRWDPLIFELLKAPPFICGEPIPPTSFFPFFWHVMPTRPSDTAVPRFFFFLFNYLPQKLFAHFKKGLQRCNFSVQESRNIYLLFCCIYLQEFFLSFMLFFLTVYMHISSSFLLRGYLNGKEILYYCSDQFHK